MSVRKRFYMERVQKMSYHPNERTMRNEGWKQLMSEHPDEVAHILTLAHVNGGINLTKEGQVWTGGACSNTSLKDEIIALSTKV